MECPRCVGSTLSSALKVKVKAPDAWRGCAVTEGWRRYCSDPFMAFSVERVVQHHSLADLPQEKTRFPLCRGLDVHGKSAPRPAFVRRTIQSESLWELQCRPLPNSFCAGVDIDLHLMRRSPFPEVFMVWCLFNVCDTCCLVRLVLLSDWRWSFSTYRHSLWFENELD